MSKLIGITAIREYVGVTETTIMDMIQKQDFPAKRNKESVWVSDKKMVDRWLKPSKTAAKRAAAKANSEEEAKEKLEKVNFNNTEMKHIIPKLADWTGKDIIPDAGVMGQKLTIYSPREMVRERALKLIYMALRKKGFVAETTDDIIFLKPLKEAITGMVPLIGPDQPLAAVGATAGRVGGRRDGLANRLDSTRATISWPGADHDRNASPASQSVR